MSTKHICFFSNYCQYCHDFLTDIVKKGLRQKFILVSVEKHPIPPYVDRVPFIMTSDKKVVLEQNIPIFIEKLMEEHVNKEDDIIAYAPCPKGHFGSEYCSIDSDVPKKNDVSSVLGYVFLDEDEKQQSKPEIGNYLPTTRPPLKPKIDQSIFDLDITYPQNTSQLGDSIMNNSSFSQNNLSQPPVYNPNVNLQSTPQLPSFLRPQNIEKPQKMNEQMYEKLLQQRMSEAKAFEAQRALY